MQEAYKTKIEEFKNTLNTTESVEVVNTYIQDAITNLLNEYKTSVVSQVNISSLTNDLKQEFISSLNSSRTFTAIENVIQSKIGSLNRVDREVLTSILNYAYFENTKPISYIEYEDQPDMNMAF